MHEFATDLWRLSKELPGSPTARLIQLVAGVAIICVTTFALTTRVWRAVVLFWRWMMGGKVEPEEPEGA